MHLKTILNHVERHWAIPVFLTYALRRVDCAQCGVTVERIPWCDGKHAQCTTYRWFLARWAQRLSWDEVATVFRASWDSVYRAVEYAVSWGLAHRKLEGIEAIGLDEVQWQRGHKYLTLVYQIGNTLADWRTSGFSLILQRLGSG